jgi:hypothetical protein
MAKRKSNELSGDESDPLDIIGDKDDETVPWDNVIRDEIVPEAIKANPGSMSFTLLGTECGCT